MYFKVGRIDRSSFHAADAGSTLAGKMVERVVARGNGTMGKAELFSCHQNDWPTTIFAGDLLVTRYLFSP